MKDESKKVIGDLYKKHGLDENENQDERIVYGMCTWWGSIHEAGDKGIPCCPHCNSNLFEMPSIKVWNHAVEQHEKNGHAGYSDFINWLRGKCFNTYQKAYDAYYKETGKSVEGFVYLN